MAYKRIKKLVGRSLVLAAALLGASALVLLGMTSQDSEQFGRTHDLLLLINGIGAFVLLLLIASNLFHLVRDYRTGKAKGAPVCVDLRTFPVRIEDGKVFIQIG